ncbi:hypothetical protein B5K05_16475 [Rhizobium phaseoli]|nr:hypothetical protein CO648_20825 [Rhizobium phaseoli]RDJ08143.1 hypothetical protein B5K04_16445 [Rhizobium phaseoli]RDJ11838.1 hypothetical protein B5K05_16475 [Rhizobium phaseoli]
MAALEPPHAEVGSPQGGASKHEAPPFTGSLRVIHGADAPWLDSCDEHRNEGGWGERFASNLPSL